MSVCEKFRVVFYARKMDALMLVLLLFVVLCGVSVAMVAGICFC